MARRRTSGGRVTPKGTPPASRSATRHGRPDGHRPRQATQTPAATARYSPPKQDFVVRPRWHRVAGWVGVALGVLVAVLNDVMLMGDGLVLLPFGHSELYLMLGLLVAGLSTRFLGLFERNTVYV